VAQKRSSVIIVVGAVLGIVALGVLPASAGGGGHCADPLAEGTGTAVEMRDACFTPAVLHVGVDEEITFTNLDPMAHNVAPAGWGWGHVDALRQGDSFTASFAEEGTYPYACSLHPGMTGAVIVGGIAGGNDGADLAIAGGPTPPPPSGGSPWWVAIAGAAAGLVAGYVLARARGARDAQPYQPVAGT
jgi:plastocyanin